MSCHQLLQVLLLSLLLLILHDITGISGTSNVQIYSNIRASQCPKGWVNFADSCYKFVRHNSAYFQNASQYCDNYNSRLLSVNNFEENQFILDWLQENDPNKRLWLTSALVTNGQNNWQWATDLGSKFINNNDLWLPANSSYDRFAFNGAAYTFSQSANKWGLIRIDNNRPAYSFICEYVNIPSNAAIGNMFLERGLDYGLNIHNKSLIPRGPKMVVEPKDVIFDISGRSHSNKLKLECVADGYPKPEYKWYREDNSGLSEISQGREIEVLADERMTLTDGQLTIYNPNPNEDKGKYYCEATNHFGTIVSRTVSITFYWILEFNKKRSVERGRENWGKSVSCDPPQHNSKVLYYWTKAEFPNFVQQDRRVFISFDGNLYFSSLEKIDRSDYSCQIQSANSSTGRFGPSFPLVVEPASNAQKLQFANGFPKMFPESPMDGHEIRVECMAYGYPTPVYNWTRASPTNRMPNGAYVTHDGKVLMIPRARIEDDGEYICRASSEGESLSKSIRISVQAAPRFTMPLEDQVLGEREPLVWECEAFGLPKVIYSWFKNGQEINMARLSPLDFGRFQIKENILTIDSVQKERDQGMYQCRATNQHGEAYSSAQLRIFNLRPTVEKNPMPLDLHAMVDQNVTLPCYVEAIPRPIISWRKLGSQEDRSRMRVTANGLLQITRVRVGDAGTYQCTAENNLGSITTKTALIVKPSPVIVDPLPRVDLVTFGDPLKILACDVQTDYDLEITHVWLKNGLPIDFEELTIASRLSKIESGKLVIKNVTYIDQANYTCQAKTSIGYVEKTGTLLVRGPPDQCGAVNADKLTQSSALISWTDGSDHLSRIIFNSIEGRTNHNSSWQILASNISANLVRMPNQSPISLVHSGFSRKSFQLNNVLLPFSTYEFRVAATNELGEGPWSAPSPKYRTEMSVPVKPVTNLRGGGGKAGTLLIRWDPVPMDAWGAQEIWYHVYYRLNGTYEWARRDLQGVGGHADAYTVNVGQEIYYKLFDVMIQSINQMGAGPMSKVAYIYSAQQMPRVQPTNVYGIPHNSTALNVTWNPLSEQDDSGLLVGYRIRYWPAGKDPQTHSLTNLKRGQEAWGLVVGLQPNTEYHVTVMAYNEAGSGPESESFHIRTFKWAPQRSPSSVSAEFLDDTTIKVTWRGVAHLTTNEEPILGYKVRYWRIEEPINSARDVIKPLGSDELSVIINNLVPGESYKLRVLAYSSGGDGKMSSPELLIKVKPQSQQ